MGTRDVNFYNDLFARYGWEAEARTIRDLYLDGHQTEAEAAVPAEFLEKTSLIGSPAYVRDRLAAYADAGVTALSITVLGGDPVGTVGQLKEWMA
jgi:alkanesulfonate monooxygenase SsuD/methylene tetrahydromethanopterin reductase-like flavin-dependent oxidoreductase (luciferase family)